MRRVSHLPAAQPGEVCDQANATGQILGMLGDLKSAVENLRAQISAKRKSHQTVEEVADLFGRSEYTIRRWISEGLIQAIRVEGTGPRGRLLISRDQVDALIQRGLGSVVPDALAGSDE